MGISTIEHQARMALKICLVFTVVALPICLATFAATDGSDQKLSLRRQILEEILAEIEKKELAAQREVQQPQHELQQQEFEHQQRHLVLQQQQHQFQVQQNQLKNQIQRLLLEELPQNNQLIDSLTEKTYEVVLICRSSKCVGEFDFEKKKEELTKVIKPFTEVFIARMFNLVAPETV